MGGSGIKKSVSAIAAGKKLMILSEAARNKNGFYNRYRELSTPLVGRNFGVVYF